MEPRIATLLGDSSARERITLDPILQLPPLAVSSRSQQLGGPTPLVDDAHDQSQRRSEYATDIQQASVAGVHSRQQAGAPLAKVLNDEVSSHLPFQPRPAQSTTAPAPFSGRLSDILIDPSQEHQSKRRRLDQEPPHALTGSENSLLRLPELPQLPKKTSRRPRIPPLLQGLHQPPPLPQGRLFPPITGEAGAFGRDIGDRGIIRSAAEADNGQDKGSQVAAESSSAWNEERRAKKNNEGSPARPASDKENQSAEKRSGEKESGGKQARRRRTRWSEQETKDLLLGVKKFGIGSWKQILQCEDFNLGQRTAVDLKDRFRTLCPGERTKLRSAPQKPVAGEAETVSQDAVPVPSVGQDEQSNKEGPGASKESQNARSNKEQKLAVDLANLGIDGPFAQSTRRQRREFTDRDDENLLKGYERHSARPGLLWRSIRDDPELGFGVRQPTDLRDRFRIRYPEKYAEAGKKPKQKIEKRGEDRQAEAEAEETVGAEMAPPPLPRNDQEVSVPQIIVPNTAPAERSFRPQPMIQPLLGSFTQNVDDLPDFMSEDGDIDNRSPITLSRHIFDWADANPSSMHSNVTSSAIASVASITADMGVNLFAPADTSINTFMTLNKVTHQSGGPLNTSSYAPASHATTKPYATVNAPNNATSSLPSRQELNSLMRTPNLPTIVVPPVPMASARSAVHNLPPPSDLLSGLDLDVRQDPQAPYYLDVRQEPQPPYYLDVRQDSQAPYFLDEPTNHYLTLPGSHSMGGNTSTLAPLMNGGGPRGLLALDRAVLDEPLGERSLLNSAL